MDSLLTANIPADPQDARKWSSFQEAIFSAVREADDNLLIQAVAGSGKTTTIIEATRYALGPALFLAFNRSIAEDIRGKLTAGEAKTFNALGHRLWMQNAPGARLDAQKTDKLIQQLMPDEARRRFGYLVGRVVSQAKSSGLGIDSEVNTSDFDHFITSGEWDIDDSDIASAAHYAAQVFNRARSDMQTFDFDDQLYGPVYHNWTFPVFATVLVDEAQDLNRIQHLFLEKLCGTPDGPVSRIIAVGDRHQAIYGFRGALTNSLDLIKQNFGMLELPLSISYRCPISVIAEAKQLVPHIEARLGAPLGKVNQPHDRPASPNYDLDDMGQLTDPALWSGNETLIVCRNNAPLFAAIMRMVRARRPCRVLSNALEGLQSFIKRFKTSDTQQLLVRVDRWLEKETLAAEAKGMAWKVAALEDKAATVRALCEGFHTVDEVLSMVRQLSEGRAGPLFSTIHKAKGLEADHVYFLRPDLVPGWWIKEEQALQQEYNLRYVAITRAKQTLTYGVRK